MEIKVRYASVNITQRMRVVDQKLYDCYQRLNALIPKTDADKKSASPDWLKLTDFEKGEFIIQHQNLKWIGELHKEGKLCTTESAIFKAYLAGDGVLRLPKTQGGDHPVIIELAE